MQRLREELWVRKMKLILGLTMIVIVGVWGGINALYMIVSPRAWFRLPDWIRAQGTLTEDKYSSGWGGFELRLAGAAMLATIALIWYEVFSRGRYIP